MNYIKPFDGLRVIALLGVILYHLIAIFVPSGYLGVVIFFVFAGFLTMIKISEREETIPYKMVIPSILGKIKKLYPAIIITLILVTIVMVMCFKSFLASYPIELISSLFSFNNYSQILRNESYFEAMNSLKPLTHLWALSLELQFYIIFDLFVLPFFCKENKKSFLICFIILCIGSIFICVSLINKQANLTRIYYGMDSRISTFLIGMIAAIIAPNFLGFVKKNKKVVRIVEHILIIVLILGMLVRFNTDASVIYGIQIYSVLFAVLLILIYNDSKAYYHDYAVGVKTKKSLLSLFSSKFCYEVVKRSYVAYLVHYPLIVFLNRFLAHVTFNFYLYIIVSIALIIIITEIIYRIVNIIFEKHWKKVLSPIVLIILCLLLMATAAWIKSLKIDDKSLMQNSNKVVKETIEETVKDEVIISDVTNEVSDTKEEIIEKADNNINEEVFDWEDKHRDLARRIEDVNYTIGDIARISKKDYENFKHLKITLIGDSVAECAKGALSVYFPTSYIDAHSNRELNKAVEIYNEKKANNQIGDVVVIALGTNSTKAIDINALQTIHDDLNGKPMIILTIAIPNVAEEQSRNNALIKFAEKNENVTIADWKTAMKKHTELFVGDDTHPDGTGNDCYAQLIFKTMMKAYTWGKENGVWSYYDRNGKKLYTYDVNKPVGETVKFGRYYFNDDKEKKDIEWIVLDRDEKKKKELLISKYAIDCKKYNNDYTYVAWLRASLREWLNKDFYKEAFPECGDRFIEMTTNDNHRNPKYQTTDAGVTYDKIYIASYDEAKKYFKDDMMFCKGTEYFKLKNGYVNNEEKYKGNCDWWLRTPGDTDSHVMYINSKGEYVFEGDYVNTDDFGVRPMMWINYEGNKQYE